MEAIEDSKKDLIQLARQRFQLASEAESEIRLNALDDLKFRSGDQWPDIIRQARASKNRPCLTINRLPQFIRQITNDQRQNRPAIKVSPVDDKGDVDVAKVFQGLIRHIEYDSNADGAYDTAFEGAVTKGFGFFRVVTEYADPMSFELVAKIKRIRDSFSVYLDPFSQEPDGSDAEWGFIVEDLSREAFERDYPNSQLSNMQDWLSVGNHAPGWIMKDSCRVAEYFYKEYEDTELVMLPDGSVEKYSPEIPEEYIIEKRKTKIPVVKWCKINGIEVLEKSVWPGLWIPIIPVYGDELYIEGKRILEGVVRHAKDPQRMYNYWKSAATETIALAPKAPFIGVAGQFEGFEKQWKTANTETHAYLEYNPKTIAGQAAPPPMRQVYEPPIQAITQELLQSSEDIKNTTGIYDASLGNRSNETSGIAIQRRNIQAQTSNFHFIDNLSRSMRHLGRILVDLIPKIYDTPRTVRIIGEDGEQEVIAINQIFEKAGKKKAYYLNEGKYDVTVSTGPSYASKRQESVDAMLQLTQSYPKVAEVAGDLMVKNMDWPGAQEIAERLKKTMPPELVSDEEQEIPQAAIAQMQQMSVMIEQLSQQLNAAQDAIQTKAVEIESKERIEKLKLEMQYELQRMKTEADLRMALLKEDASDSREAFKAEIAQLDRMTQMDSGREMAESQGE